MFWAVDNSDAWIKPIKPLNPLGFPEMSRPAFSKLSGAH